MENDNITTMRIARSTLDRLASFGRKGQSYEQIVIDLMNKVKRK